MRSSLLLFAGVALVLMAAGEANAEKEPVWSYDIGNVVRSVDISADGEYIAANSNDNKVYLFDKDSSTPLWNYTTGGVVWSMAISADGEYIVAGSQDNKIYFFSKDSSDGDDVGIPPLSVILTLFAWVSLANIPVAIIALRRRLE